MLQQLKRAATAMTISALAFSAFNANAEDFSFTGNFSADNEVQTFNFTITEASFVTLRTWSYAGGVNAAGQTIARGGFDPILALFDAATGQLVNTNDDGGSSLVANDAVTGNAWDTYLNAELTPGEYIVSIQQYDNFAAGNNIADGFRYDGAGYADFRNGFYDVSGDQRDSHWAFDILNANVAVANPPAVPEPETYGMLLAGLLVVGAVARRRKTGVA